jgi:hypothetical protein
MYKLNSRALKAEPLCYQGSQNAFTLPTDLFVNTLNVDQ